ncbi:MAG TPA: hypothetical protein VH682_08190, partial [Gemmataceae bacterium]
QQEKGGLVVFQSADKERRGEYGLSVAVTDIGRVKEAVTVAVDLGDAIKESAMGGMERVFEFTAPLREEAVIIKLELHGGSLSMARWPAVGYARVLCDRTCTA